GGPMLSRHRKTYRSAIASTCFLLLAVVLFVPPSLSEAAERRSFQIEEATIADIHRAILARQLTATHVVEAYVKSIAAYDGTCVKAAVDPATGFQLGDIEPIEHAGKLNALITLNLRGKRSKTDTADNDPKMPDAIETAKALDAEFARTGRLKGP